jgi:hypothetical protein
MPTREEFADEARKTFAMTGSAEAVLRHLKASGASKTDCVAALTPALGISLQESNEIVSLSETWRPSRVTGERKAEALPAAFA